MDYTNQPVCNLLRGPLLNTPQGLVVCAAAIGYLLFALLVVLGIATPPLKLGVSGVVIGAVGYPFVLFLLFVKNGLPSFAPSLWGSMFLVICALIPVGFVLWRA